VLYIISFFFGFIGPFPFTSYSHVTSGGPCPRGTSFTLSTLSAPVLLPFVHVLTLRLSLSCTYVETYGNTMGIPMGIFIFCFSSSLLCPCPCPAGCLLVFLVVVLDLMTHPRCRPFFLFPIVTAFFSCCVAVFLHCVLGLSTCFPQEGRLHQYPCLRLMAGSWGLFPRRQIPMLMMMTLRSKVFFARSPLVSLYLAFLALNRLCSGI
jgi:hypothetical protein